MTCKKSISSSFNPFKMSPTGRRNSPDNNTHICLLTWPLLVALQPRTKTTRIATTEGKWNCIQEIFSPIFGMMLHDSYCISPSSPIAIAGVTRQVTPGNLHFRFHTGFNPMPSVGLITHYSDSELSHRRRRIKKNLG